MKRFTILAGVIAGTLLAQGAALAHHSFAAEFDRDLPITVTGTVTKVEWANPHARFYIDAKDDNGQTVNWDFELASPNGLMRRGWTRNTLEIGTDIMVQGTRARDGSLKGNAQSVIITEGCQRLFAGTSQRDFVEDEAAPVEACVF